MPEPGTKATLLEKLRIERSRLEQLLAELTPEQMQQPGVDQEWSVKDILAHLTVWNQRGLGWIETAVRGEPPAIPLAGKTWAAVDELNRETYLANHDRPLAAVLADYEASHRQVVALVEALSEEDLRKRVKGQGKGEPGIVSTLVKWRYRHIRGHCKPIADFVAAMKMKPSQSPSSNLQSPSYVVGHRIRDMHEDERPRERLLAYGPSVLSNAELLAILLRVGIQGENAVMMAQRILTTFGGLTGLARTSAREMGAIKGLGEAKACQLLAALELGKRLAATSPTERPVITSPADAANLLMLEMSLLDHEQLRVLLLDTKNQVHSTVTVYKGTVNSSQVRVAEIFKDAVKHNYPALIVVHNHPSGDPTPSRDDVRVTRDLVQAGELLGISVLDHIVLGQNRFVSMKERGLGF